MSRLVLLLLFSHIAFGHVLPGQLRFIENKGQWPKTFQFKSDIPGGHLYIGSNRLYYQLAEASNTHKHQQYQNHDHEEHELRHGSSRIRMHGLAVEFLGAMQGRFYGENPDITRYNFYLGDDSSQWASGAHAYPVIRRDNIYPGVDMALYSSIDRLKYDFYVHPGADPNAIAIQYQGADKLELRHGNLNIHTSLGKITEQHPYAYQIINSDTVEISCSFVLDDGVVRYTFPDGYDSSRLLVIDPLLIFSTFSGSEADNWGFTAAFDEDGNTFSGGIVANTGFPTTVGAYSRQFNGGQWDIGILKFDSLGQDLIYATYLGGARTELPQSLVSDNEGNLYVLGISDSYNYPRTTGIGYQSGVRAENVVSGINFEEGSDLVITSLDPEGRLRNSRMLGGHENEGMLESGHPLIANYGDHFRGDIFINIEGKILIATSTKSDFLTTVDTVESVAGTSTALIIKMEKETLEVEWVTDYGNMGGQSSALSVKQPDSNNIYVGGIIQFPSGSIDGFIMQLDPITGNILKDTIMGTPSDDLLFFIDLDNEGNVYAMGQTYGNWPTKGAVYRNSGARQFLMKMDSSLTDVEWSTVFGSANAGVPNISPTAFLVNECGNIFIAGWGGNSNLSGNTNSLPLTEDAFQPQTDGSDFYLMVLKKDAASLLYATYFGGQNSNDHVDGGTSRFDKRGIVYHAVCGGCGGSNNFPTTEGSWSRTNLGGNCNNAVFKFDLSSIKADFTTFDSEWVRPSNTACTPYATFNFKNNSIGGIDILWDFDNGTTSEDRDSLTVTYDTPGTYEVTLTLTDENTCEVTDIAVDTLYVFEGEFSVIEDQVICPDDSVELSAEGAVAYIWSPQSAMMNFNKPNPIVFPFVTTTYSLEAIDENGCRYYDSVTVEVIPEYFIDFTVDKVFDCFNSSEFTFKGITSDTVSFFWDFGDGVTAEGEEVTHVYANSGSYEVVLRGVQEVCEKVVIKNNSVELFKIPNLITPGDKNAVNDAFAILDETGRAPTSTMSLQVFDRLGNNIYSSEDYRNDWQGEDVGTGYYYYYLDFLQEETSCKGWLHILK